MRVALWKQVNDSYAQAANHPQLPHRIIFSSQALKESWEEQRIVSKYKLFQAKVTIANNSPLLKLFYV